MVRKNTKKEPREKKRVLISEEVRIRCEDWDEFQVQHVENISEGGVFIKTNQPLKPGEVFRLCVDVGGEELAAVAQVIWTKEFSEVSPRASGMGARFLEIDQAWQDRIRQLTESPEKA